MHLSNFRPVKRVVDVVKVFARVASELPAQLVLAGDGPDRSAAERGYIDAVIFPEDTRRHVIQALKMLQNKRQKNPSKKHGNIPL